VLSSPAAIFAAILFGTIGLAALAYGRRRAQWRPALIGAALIAYPYFVETTWILYAVGCALCAALFVVRE